MSEGIVYQNKDILFMTIESARSVDSIVLDPPSSTSSFSPLVLKNISVASSPSVSDRSSRHRFSKV